MSQQPQLPPEVAKELNELTTAIFEIFKSRNTIPNTALAALFNEVCYVAAITIGVNPSAKPQLVADIQNVMNETLNFIKNMEPPTPKGVS